MKSVILPVIVVCAMSVLTLYSQTSPAPDAALNKIKASNQALIERQNKTLETLEAIKQTAEQLKIFSKRG